VASTAGEFAAGAGRGAEGESRFQRWGRSWDEHPGAVPQAITDIAPLALGISVERDGVGGENGMDGL
jgi:hypothetical protein